MDINTKPLEETSKEIQISEIKCIPRFFDGLEEEKGNADAPVSKLDDEYKNKIYIITRNESLDGDIHPITGVPFEKQTIELPNGEVVEGVFPEFETTFDAQIPENLYCETDYKQFKNCNEQLYHEIENNPDLKAKFTKEQVEQIMDGMADGTAPDGYVWHHSATPGKIQLVNFETHAGTGHTGGRTVWGGGNDSR